MWLAGSCGVISADVWLLLDGSQLTPPVGSPLDPPVGSPLDPSVGQREQSSLTSTERTMCKKVTVLTDIHILVVKQTPHRHSVTQIPSSQGHLHEVHDETTSRGISCGLRHLIPQH